MRLCRGCCGSNNRHWGYKVQEYKIRANFAYLDFSLVGLNKVPGNRTLAQISQATDEEL
jgi:hypothetical protein